MDLHPTGSKELQSMNHDVQPMEKEIQLIEIDTPYFNFILKGKPEHPKSKGKMQKDSNSTVRIQCKEECTAYILEQEYKLDQGYKIDQAYKIDQESKIKYKNEIPTNPLFYEHQNYQLVIESKKDVSITFHHENKLLRDKVGYVGKSRRFLMGLLNFASEIGMTDLEIYVNGERYLTLTLEIFPSKLDYKEDYLQILQDVNEEIYNLAFDFLRKTYLWASLRDSRGNSPTEFFSILQMVFDSFLKSVDQVLKLPHHTLQVEKNIVPAHKSRGSSKEMLRWMQKHPQHVQKVEDGFRPQRILTVQKQISYDTFENRVVKHILQRIITKLNKVKEHYQALYRDKDPQVIYKIQAMVNGLQRRIQFSFLEQVGELHTLNALSLVLHMAPGYKDVLKYYLMMQKGLSLDGELYRISTKNLAELYEYWCFIKLNGLLRKKYTLISQDILQADYRGLFVQLKKGQTSQMRYRNPANGEVFTISYNRKEIKGPTVAQKPDNMLILRKEKSDVEYKYIFDAKYKVQYKLTKANPPEMILGPQEEDINTMHRYRDAIVSEEKNQENYERAVFGAYVLFPYNDEARYAEHDFYKSIEKVNVGAFPFLPSATSLVEKFLDQLIEASSHSLFDKVTLQQGMLEYLEQLDLRKRDVLVGPVKSKEQLQANKDKKFYHIPQEQIPNKEESFSYVALCEPKTVAKDGQGGIFYFGKIKAYSIQKRKEFVDLFPMTQNNSDKLYVVFEIEKWEKVGPIARPEGYRLRNRMYTNKALLQYAKTLPELCIRNVKEFRLLLELKRLTEDFVVKADNQSIDDSSMEYIAYNGGQIFIKEGYIQIVKEKQSIQHELQEFLHRPAAKMKEIKKWIDRNE